MADKFDPRKAKESVLNYFPQEKAPVKLPQYGKRPDQATLDAIINPQFNGIKNTIKGRESAEFNNIEQDIDKRDALQEIPGGPAPATIPSPYMRPKSEPALDAMKKQYGIPMIKPEQGVPMVKPNIQTEELPSPSMRNNPPLDDEDLKVLGLLPK